MKDILKLIHFIDDEVDGACEYATKAIWYKDHDNSNFAQTFYEMAQQELKHADKLHDMLNVSISKLNDTNECMKDLWECKHAKLIDCIAHAREMVSMFTR